MCKMSIFLTNNIQKTWTVYVLLRLTDSVSNTLFSQASGVGGWSSAAGMPSHQQCTGIKELGEEELEGVSTSATRRTLQTSSESCLCYRMQSDRVMWGSMWLCRRPWTAHSCCSTLVFPSCRRSTTAGGRLSTAKTRCGTWPKWWASQQGLCSSVSHLHAAETHLYAVILHSSSVSDCGGWHLFETVWDDGRQLDLSGFSHIKRARMDFC